MSFRSVTHGLLRLEDSIDAVSRCRDRQSPEECLNRMPHFSKPRLDKIGREQDSFPYLGA